MRPETPAPHSRCNTENAGGGGARCLSLRGDLAGRAGASYVVGQQLPDRRPQARFTMSVKRLSKVDAPCAFGSGEM